MNKFLILLTALLIGASNLSAQSLIRGRVVSDSISVEGVNIVNLVTKSSTITDAQGRFSIAANAGDLLVFSAVQLEINRYTIEPEDINKDQLIIRMVGKINELEETVVNQYSHVNAEALGIIPYGQKKYTPAERKLASASSGPVDILVNMFSGRLDMRKKEVEVEKKERLLERLEILYKKSFYTATLKIPEGQIQAFRYFAVEDPDLATALKQRNSVQSTFILSDLARRFLLLTED